MDESSSIYSLGACFSLCCLFPTLAIGIDLHRRETKSDTKILLVGDTSNGLDELSNMALYNVTEGGKGGGFRVTALTHRNHTCIRIPLF